MLNCWASEMGMWESSLWEAPNYRCAPVRLKLGIQRISKVGYSCAHAMEVPGFVFRVPEQGDGVMLRLLLGEDHHLVIRLRLRVVPKVRDNLGMGDHNSP